MKVLVLLLLLTVSIYADPIIDLGVLTPGSDNVMELEIPLWIHSRENEVHYVRYEWRSDGFNGSKTDTKAYLHWVNAAFVVLRCSCTSDGLGEDFLESCP
jgi:hypothetical protein